MSNWGSMVDPNELIKEMLALKASLEDFAKRMERVERVLFKEAQDSSCDECGYYRCWRHGGSM